jgi:zinc D-Ala-D-Ala carboxypeptidase
MAPCGYSGTHPTIRYGDRGSVVAHAQCLLRNVRGHLSVDVDGVFGPITRGAVIAEQRRCRIVQDGIVGPITWNCLHP